MKKSVLVSFLLTIAGVFMLNAQNHVTIYRSCNYQGDSQRLYEGDYRDRDIQIGNDRISAIRIPKGWGVTVYKANNFQGPSETYDSDVRCLPEQFNDAISSIRVFKSSNANAVTIFRSCNFSGDSQILREGRYRDRDIRIGNDRISSIRVPNGWAVTVYKANNFEGTSETYYDDIRCLPQQFNDAISSLRVFRSSGKNKRSYRNDNRNTNSRNYNNRSSRSNFNATGKVPCKMERGAPTSNCDFGVVRRGGGDADVHIKTYKGTRIIYFQNGRAVGYDRSQGGGSFRASKESDLYIVHIGDERYEIPEPVIYGD
jgi:hypothetical protein